MIIISGNLKLLFHGLLLFWLESTFKSHNWTYSVQSADVNRYNCSCGGQDPSLVHGQRSIRALLPDINDDNEWRHGICVITRQVASSGVRVEEKLVSSLTQFQKVKLNFASVVSVWSVSDCGSSSSSSTFEEVPPIFVNYTSGGPPLVLCLSIHTFPRLGMFQVQVYVNKQLWLPWHRERRW